MMPSAATIAAMKIKPIRVTPFCLCMNAPGNMLLAYALADPLERKARHVVPVPPDEECLATNMVVRHKAPVTAVFAVIPVVAHHEVLSRRHLARESGLIVYAVFASWKRSHAAHADGRRIGQVGDRVHPVSYTHLRAHETRHELVCRLL